MPKIKQLYFICLFPILACIFANRKAFCFENTINPQIMLAPKMTIQNQAIKESLLSSFNKGVLNYSPIDLEDKIANGASLKIKASSVRKLIEMAEEASPETFDDLFSTLVSYLSHPDKSIRNEILRWIFNLASNDPNRIIVLLETIQKENPEDNIHYHIQRVLETLSLNRIWKVQKINPDINDFISSAI
jgi:hypothetical protein